MAANALRRSAEDGLRVLGVASTATCCSAARRVSRPCAATSATRSKASELPARSAKRQPEPPHSVLTIGLVDDPPGLQVMTVHKSNAEQFDSMIVVREGRHDGKQQPPAA